MGIRRIFKRHFKYWPGQKKRKKLATFKSEFFSNKIRFTNSNAFFSRSCYPLIIMQTTSLLISKRILNQILNFNILGKKLIGIDRQKIVLAIIISKKGDWMIFANEIKYNRWSECMSSRFFVRNKFFLDLYFYLTK